MFDIDGTLVSLDLVERFFCCDLDTCLGACCIEGDSGAPLTEEEYQKLKAVLPEVWDYLLPQAQEQIKEHGVAFVPVRHRESLPRGPHQLAQTHVVLPVSRAHQEVSGL